MADSAEHIRNFTRKSKPTYPSHHHFLLSFDLLEYYSRDILVAMCTTPQNQEVKASASSNTIKKKDIFCDEALWKINENFYDLTEFVNHHPGGTESVLLGKGRDCTALFNSYHTFSNKHRVVLQKFKVPVGKIEAGKEGEEDVFYRTLQERVNKRLLEHGIDPLLDRCASRSRLLYYLFVLCAAFFSGVMHCKGCSMFSLSFGIFGWLIGSLGHDGGHFSVSRWPFINLISRWCGMSLICNPMMWQYQHTLGHHSHTNEFDHDPDLHHFAIFLRYHKRMIYDRIYKRQQNPIYVIFAYTLVTFGECIKIPYGVIKNNSLYDMIPLNSNVLERVGMTIHLICYIIVVIFLPCLNTSLSSGLFCSIVHMATTGLLFAFFSQINHINEVSINASSDSCHKWKNSWAARQVETSNNFAPNSFFWYIFSNGLNLQIEHHLFPGLNHCHLPIIAPTVELTCKEFGVNYKCYGTWFDLMSDTLKYLYKLSITD